MEFDPILTYKICYHLLDVKFDDFFQCAETGYKLYRHRPSFVFRCKHRPKYDTNLHFFSYQIILVRNLLPESVILSSTLAAFKTHLRKFDLHDICHLTY